MVQNAKLHRSQYQPFNTHHALPSDFSVGPRISAFRITPDDDNRDNPKAELAGTNASVADKAEARARAKAETERIVVRVVFGWKLKSGD